VDKCTNLNVHYHIIHMITIMLGELQQSVFICFVCGFC